MRDRDIEPLELRDFLIMAALMAAVLVILWGTASAIVKARRDFDGPRYAPGEKTSLSSLAAARHDQNACCFRLRVCSRGLGLSGFDYATIVHDDHPIGKGPHNRQIM